MYEMKPEFKDHEMFYLASYNFNVDGNMKNKEY